MAGGQYSSTGPLSRRISFHERYARRDWFGWVREHLGELGNSTRVLDVGCGPGLIWAKGCNAELMLSDRSTTMAREAGQYGPAVVADAMALPFPDGHFDTVVAMHMLYHVPEPSHAIGEMQRVLRPGGRLVVTTVQEHDLAEMHALSRAAFGSTAADKVNERFGADKANDLLGLAFGRVTRHDFVEGYSVDNAQALVDYILSMPPGQGAEQSEKTLLQRMIETAMTEQGGAIAMQKRQALFVARKDSE